MHGPTPDMQVLEAVCHLVPDEALRVIDGMIAALQAAPGDFHGIDSLTRMISRIAHSEALFPRACESLVTLTIAVSGQRISNADDALSSLFGLYLSGTLAQTDTRIRVARQYLFANDPNHNARGIIMLRSALRTGYWSSPNLTFDDARPDAFGWEPDGEDVVEWFTKWLDLAAEIALIGPLANRDNARKSLADEIGDIWRCIPILRSRIDKVARQLQAAASWAEGRHALKQMLHYIQRRGDEFPCADTESVLRLIDHMEPVDLEARVRAEMVMGWDFELEDEDVNAAEARRVRRLELLGRELAANHDSLRAVGCDLLKAEGGSFYPLGEGLAKGAGAPVEVWVVLRDLHLIDPSRTRQTGVLSGFIQQLDISNSAVADEIRAECRGIPALRREYGIFLARGVMPTQELEHVIEIAGEPETSAWHFSDVSWREERELSDEDRVRLLRTILAKSGGPEQVVDALTMLRHVERNTRDCWPENLREVGFDAIVAIIGAEKLKLAKDWRALSACLRGDDGCGASRVMEAIVDRAARRYGSIFDSERALATLAEQAPEVFLSHVFLDEADAPSIRFQDCRRLGPLSHVPTETLIEWCRQNPDRWTKVAMQLSPFLRGTDYDYETEQISALASAFLEAAPRPEDVLEAYLKNITPMSWSGSRAAIMERRLAIIESLQDHPAPEVGHTISRLAPDIRARIDRIRQAEQEENRERDQRFE